MAGHEHLGYTSIERIGQGSVRDSLSDLDCETKLLADMGSQVGCRQHTYPFGFAFLQITEPLYLQPVGLVLFHE